MVFPRIARKILPEVVGQRARRTEATAAEAIVKHAVAADGAIARDAVAEVARANAPFARRAPELVATKYQRMAESPHAFFRGSPTLFYRDLAATGDEALSKGPTALLQGDLHLGNLGAVMGAEGKLAWGLVDVDEAATGPVKAELRRMATSVHLTGREAGLGKHEADELVERFAKAYHETLEEVARHPQREPGKPPDVVKKFLDDAGDASRKRWLAELAPEGPAGRRFARSEKALDVPQAVADDVAAAFAGYRASLPRAEAEALKGYRVTDVVAPVTGVNSLGRRRYRVLALPGDGKGEALVFDLKEQLVPALGAHVPQGKAASHAARARQAAEGLNGGRMAFMGETTLAGPGAGDGSFLVRRLEPWHGAIEAGKLGKGELEDLVKAAGEIVARGHARGEALGFASAGEILADLGKRKDLQKDLAAFGRSYAGKVVEDHAAFVAALKPGGALTKPR